MESTLKYQSYLNLKTEREKNFYAEAMVSIP